MQLKRRQAIEPIIGHLKSDHRMDRCHLKGIAFLQRLYLRLYVLARVSQNWQDALGTWLVRALTRSALPVV